MAKSYEKQENEIKQCLAAKQAEAELDEFFSQSFGVNLDNFNMDSLMKVLKKLYGESKEAVDKLNEKYK